MSYICIHIKKISRTIPLRFLVNESLAWSIAAELQVKGNTQNVDENEDKNMFSIF
jgi:hypothetical protein